MKVKAKISKKAYVAKNATVVGNVIIEEEASIWYQSVVRGHTKERQDAKILIGKRSNIQDGCVLHMDEGYPLIIGNGVTVGHKVMLHGCQIGENTLIGMSATVLNGAKIGKNCMIGAGSLVTQNMVIPDGHMAFGAPARVIRPLTEEEINSNKKNADFYVEEAKEFYNNYDF